MLGSRGDKPGVGGIVIPNPREAGEESTRESEFLEGSPPRRADPSCALGMTSQSDDSATAGGRSFLGVFAKPKASGV